MQVQVYTGARSALLQESYKAPNRDGDARSLTSIAFLNHLSVIKMSGWGFGEGQRPSPSLSPFPQIVVTLKSFECDQNEWVGFWGRPAALPKPLPFSTDCGHTQII